MDGFFPSGQHHLLEYVCLRPFILQAKGVATAYLSCFSILLQLTFPQFLFKVYKCISTITTSNYSFH